jgi:hypothetical protein
VYARLVARTQKDQGPLPTRAVAARPTIVVMTEGKHELVIEIDAGPGPLTGHIRDETGARYPFAGWLGFASALGLALGEDADDARESASRSAP